MPLPVDDKVNETSAEILKTFKTIFGPHPGFRPGTQSTRAVLAIVSPYTQFRANTADNAAHAKGILLKGTFTPTAKGGELSKAQHFAASSTPVIARFSSSPGIPGLAETARRVHTDIISHSVPFFPAPDGQSALEFFQSIPNGTIGEYVASHPAALAFVQAPKPFPSSFGREAYYSVNAFKLVSADGKGTFVRYRFVPVAGEDHLSDDAAKEKSANYLYDGVPETLKTGPIQFQLKAQVAQDGDVTDDNTKHWPDDREIVDLGLVSLESVYEDADQKTIIFDPVPRVEGVEPSADPLLDIRASVYLQSGRERRAA